MDHSALWRALTCAALVALPAPAMAGTVTVQANQDQSVSGRDDLTLARSYFTSGTMNLDAQGIQLNDEVWSYLRQIGYASVRGINTHCGDLDASHNFISCDRLDTVLSASKQRDLKKVHIIVGEHVAPPRLVTEYGAPSTWTQAAWDDYALAYAYGEIKYVASTYGGSGFDEVLFEVENEVDAMTSHWTSSETWTPGDARGFTAYMKVYRAWERGLKKFAAEVPSKAVKIAGPAMSDMSWAWDPTWPVWVVQFLQTVQSENLRLDACTFHVYGDFARVQGDGSPTLSSYQPGSTVKTLSGRVRYLKNQLGAIGRASTPVLATEFGSSSVSAPINYRSSSAAWLCAFTADGLASQLDGAVLLLNSDHGDDGAANHDISSIGGPSWLHNGKDWTSTTGRYPKPYFNVARMFGMLPGTRRVASTPSDRPNLGVFAGASGTSVGVIVYDYAWDFEQGVDSSVDEPIDLRIAGLPAASGTARVRLYQIDETHSNVGWFVDNGNQTPIRAQTELQLTADTRVDFSGNALSIPGITLPRAAVYYWQIDDVGAPTPDGGQGVPTFDAGLPPADSGALESDSGSMDSGSISTSRDNAPTAKDSGCGCELAVPSPRAPPVAFVASALILLRWRRRQKQGSCWRLWTVG